MNKKVKIILSITIIALLMIFTVGVINKGLILNLMSPSREIVVYYPDKDHPNDVLYAMETITDYKDQHKIDLFDVILWSSKDIDNADVDINKIDLRIMINSPRQGTGLSELKLWFKDDKCIIGNRIGETWEDIRFKELDEDWTKELKKVINYDESLKENMDYNKALKKNK